MKKKEHYKHILPHYQQPGQTYFVTWCLKDAVPSKAIARYKTDNEEKKNQIDTAKTLKKSQVVIDSLKKEYLQLLQQYIKAYKELLDISQPSIDLVAPEILNIIKESLHFWEGKKLETYAYCVMPNHVHWAFRVFEKEEDGKPVYLQDIMHSVKRNSSYKINKLLNRHGTLWQKESYDTTIRDDIHLMNTIDYTLNNPVKAGFVDSWEEWDGCWVGEY